MHQKRYSFYLQAAATLMLETPPSNVKWPSVFTEPFDVNETVCVQLRWCKCPWMRTAYRAAVVGNSSACPDQSEAGTQQRRAVSLSESFILWYSLTLAKIWLGCGFQAWSMFLIFFPPESLKEHEKGLFRWPLCFTTESTYLWAALFEARGNGF